MVQWSGHACSCVRDRHCCGVGDRVRCCAVCSGCDRCVLFAGECVGCGCGSNCWYSLLLVGAVAVVQEQLQRMWCGRVAGRSGWGRGAGCRLVHHPDPCMSVCSVCLVAITVLHAYRWVLQHGVGVFCCIPKYTCMCECGCVHARSVQVARTNSCVAVLVFMRTICALYSTHQRCLGSLCSTVQEAVSN